MVGQGRPNGKPAITTLGLADSHILHLSRVLSTPGGIDVSLSTLYYILRFVHARLTDQLSRQYERLAVELTLEASGALLPGEASVTSVKAPRTKLSEACVSVQALSSKVSEYRAFTRLWGLLGIYAWARGLYLDPPSDAFEKSLVWTQILANVGYAVFENGAVLIGHGVIRGRKWVEREADWYRWSSQCWLAHIVLEAVRLLRVRQLEAQKSRSNGGEKQSLATRKEFQSAWRRDFYLNGVWAPLALHWSLPDGESPVTETWIGLLGMGPGIVRLRKLWKDTA